MVRRKSVVWGFFKNVDAEFVQCLLCLDFLAKSEHGTTTNMLRHLRAKHPTEVVRKITGCGPEITSVSGHQKTDSERFFSVEVTLEGGDPEGLTTGKDAGLNSANVTLEAPRRGPAGLVTHEEVSDDRPVRRRWSLIWRHFERLDSLGAARCHICMKKLHCFEGGSTSNLHRHMSKRHPEVFSQLVANGQNPSPSYSSQRWNVNADTSKRPEDVGATEGRPLSVEVNLEDEVSDALTTRKDAGLNSACVILEAAQEGRVEQITHEQANDDRPVRRRRSLIWRHFERLDSLAAVRCRICMKELHCFESGSTSNLHRHMSKRHPEVFSQLVANGQKPPPSHSLQRWNVNADTSARPEDVGASEKRPFLGALKVSRVSGGEKRVFEREQELIESLRRVQREEARALEHQKELLEKLRAAHARETAAERAQIESLRKAQLEEAQDVSRQKEELQKEKAELQKKWEELQQEREELLLFSRGQPTS